LRDELPEAGEKTGTYRVGPEIKIDSVPRITRHNVADFIARQITDVSFIHSSPSISY